VYLRSSGLLLTQLGTSAPPISALRKVTRDASYIAPRTEQYMRLSPHTRLFMRTSDLVQRLQIARRDLALESTLTKLDKYHLLILDDMSQQGSSGNHRPVRVDRKPLRAAIHADHRQSTVRRGQGLPDQPMTLAAIDRLVHQ
jgi:hypothetical protein